MLRHSLNAFLKKLKNRQPQNLNQEKIKEATEYLNRSDFHKQIRNSGFQIIIKYHQLSYKCSCKRNILLIFIILMGLTLPSVRCRFGFDPTLTQEL